MLLPFLLPGKIWVASCWVSSWLISSVPPHLGLLWRRGPPSPPSLWWPLRRPPPRTLHLHSPGRAAGGDHRRKLPQGVHGCGRHVRQPGPGATAMPAAAHPGGSAATKWVLFSDPLVSSPSQQVQPRIHPGTVFLLPCREVFARPGLAAPSQPSQRRYLQCQRKPVTSINLWPVPSSPEVSAQGGALWRLPTPWFVARPSMLTVLRTPASLYTVYSPCI